VTTLKLLIICLISHNKCCKHRLIEVSSVKPVVLPTFKEATFLFRTNVEMPAAIIFD